MDSDSLGIHVDWVKTQLRFIITAFHKSQLKSTQLSQQNQWIQLKSDSMLTSWIQNSSEFLFCQLVHFVNPNRFAHHCLEDQVHPTVCVSVTHLSAPYFPCVDVGYLAYRYWEFKNYSKKCLINDDNQSLIYIILWFVCSELGLCILHCCYVKGRSMFIMPKTRTNRFLKSFFCHAVFRFQIVWNVTEPCEITITYL